MGSVLAFALLLAAAVGGIVVLVADALNRIPPNLLGVAVAAVFPLLLGAVVFVAGLVVGYLLDLVTDYRLGLAAVVVLTIFGAANAAVRVSVFFVEPKLIDVLRRKASIKQYLNARKGRWLLAWLFALAATLGTAYLTFGGDVLEQFLRGRLQDGFNQIR